MPHVEFINPAQAEDNIATLKIDDQIYSLEQVMANTSLASHAVGDFYPATPFNSTSLQVNLTKNPSLLAKEIFADDQLKEIIYTDNNKFIVLNGSFVTDTILNITFISPFGVILSNATFTNFEIVNILSPSGVVYIYNSMASNFVINSHCVLLSGELTTLSLTVNSTNLVQKGSILANTLTVIINKDKNAAFTIKDRFPATDGYRVDVNNYNYKIGDFNGDGKADLIHLVDITNIRIWLSNGDGTFTIKDNFFAKETDEYDEDDIDKSNYDFLVGDFNGDGKDDLIHFFNEFSTYTCLSNGDGTFSVKGGFPSDDSDLMVGVNTYEFQVGDFNGDGKADLIQFYFDNGSQFVLTWLSNGDGTYTVKNKNAGFTINDSSRHREGYGLHFNHNNYKIGDFNGDSKTDLIHFDTTHVSVLLSKGDGVFIVKDRFPDGGSAYDGYGVAANIYNYQVGDFNGDGKTDLIHFVCSDYTRVWLSNGDGTFIIKDRFPVTDGYRVDANNYNYKAGDFNGDGKTDLIHFFDNFSTYTWLSNGDGTFSIEHKFPAGGSAYDGYGVAANIYNYQVGDFNGDGKTDLIHFVCSNYIRTWLTNDDGVGIIILGKLLTQNDISISLGQTTIHIGSQASIESREGFFRVTNAFSFTNNIILKAKQGIYISASKGVKNNKVIATYGSLTIEIISPVLGGSGVEILGEIQTQHNVSIILHGHKLYIDPHTIFNIGGFLEIRDVYEFVNHFNLFAKAGIIINTPREVVNHKAIITEKSLLITARSFKNHGTIEADVLHIEITSLPGRPLTDTGVTLSGEIQAQRKATIILHGLRLYIDPHTIFNMEGILEIHDVYEFVNHLNLIAKAGIIINTPREVVNHKAIITEGSLLINAWSFDNLNYVNVGGVAEYCLKSFANRASGYMIVGGLIVHDLLNTATARIEQFSNLGVIQVGALTADICANNANFLGINGRVEKKQVDGTQYITNPDFVYNRKQLCYHSVHHFNAITFKNTQWDLGSAPDFDLISLLMYSFDLIKYYEHYFSSHPVGSYFESNSDITFNVGTLTQGYSKIYSSGRILFMNTAIVHNQIALHREEICDGCSFQIIYRTYNPIMHGVGGFFGTSTGLRFSSSGSNVPQLEYNAATIDFTQGTRSTLTQGTSTTSNAVALYQPSAATEFVSLQGLYISGGVTDIIFEGKSLLGGFFPSAFVWESVLRQMSYGHFKPNHDDFGALVVWGHPTVDNSQSAYALVPVGTDQPIRMLGDPLLNEHIFNEAIFKLFSSIRGINNNDLFALLSQECSKISARFGIAYGEAPTISQVNAAYNPMACPIKTTQCYDLAPECYDYKIFYSDKCLRHFASDAGASLLTEGGIDVEINGNMLIGYMAKIEAGQEITLNINGDVLVLGGIKGGGVKLDVTGNLVSTGTLESTADLEIDAKNIAIAGEVSAKNNLEINAVHRLILASLKSISETGGYGDYSYNSQIITETKVKADGELSLKSGDDLTIIGVHVIGKEVQITSQNGRVDIVPLALYKKAVTSARRYYYEHRSLNFYQSVIEALEPNQADFKNGVVRLGNDVAKHRGAKGIVIEAESGILLNSVNAYTDGKFKLVSPNGDIKLATSSEYNSMVWSYTKDRGGVAGAFGGTKTHYKREESSTPLISRIVAAVIEFVTPKNIEIGIDIITYAVEFNRDGATKDSMISIIPKMATYYIETKTTKKGLLFEFSDSGNFIFAGSKTKGEVRAEVQVIPTVIQLGGITDDPNNPPRFLIYSKGTFQMVSSRIEEYRDQSGNLVEGRKSVIIIQTDDIVLESVPDSKFNFAVLDEKGVGIGFNANSGEVALKAGLFGYKEQSATVETKHKNPPSLVSEYLLLNATNSLKDVQAVYDAKQMDIHAKIIFHGVAKDSVTQTDLTRIMEIGAKIGFKFGSLGRMVDAASRATQQDFNTPEGIINGGFAAFQGYHEALKLMTGSGGMGAGAWAFAHYSEEKSTSTITKEIPTVIRAGSLKIETESWELVGTQVAAYRAYIKAKNVKTRPAQMSRDSSSSSNSFDVEIPLSSGAPLGLSGSIGGSKGQERIMMNARIHIHEDLRLEVTGHADMKGVSLSAKSLEAFFNSLLLESVQDISKHSSWGVSLGLSSKDISSIGGQISNSERHAVRELTSILGSNKCNIVVANALRLNGAMIANAHRADDGTYSDHGALTLSVGELFVQHIYDYDHGYTLGATISNSAFMPTIGGRDGEGETLSTLGGGKVKCTTEGGTCETNQANRDVANPQTWTQHYDIDPITAYIPIGGLPNLPKTPEGEVDWDKVNKNLEKQVNTLFNDLINIFADNKVEEIPLPKTDNCQDDGDETGDVKDEDPTKKAKEEFIKAFREGLEKQFGKEEAARLARIGMHRASKLIGSLESLDPKNYVVDGDKIIIALPKKGVIKAGAGQAYEVAFDIISSEAAKQAGKGVVKVGKYFVRVNPYVLATLTAYEIGSYVYENREDIALKLGEVTEFARKMVDNARDTSRQKTKQDLAGNYGSPNPDPDNFEPDDNNENHKSKTRTKIEELAKKLKEEYNWDVSNEVKDKMSEEFKGKGEVKINRDGEGIKWETKHGQNDIRVDKGDPTAPHSSQQVDHVRVNRNGQVIGRNGGVVKETPEFPKPKNNPDSHIPVEEWIKWKK